MRYLMIAYFIAISFVSGDIIRKNQTVEANVSMNQDQIKSLKKIWANKWREFLFKHSKDPND